MLFFELVIVVKGDGMFCWLGISYRFIIGINEGWVVGGYERIGKVLLVREIGKMLGGEVEIIDDFGNYLFYRFLIKNFKIKE